MIGDQTCASSPALSWRSSCSIQKTSFQVFCTPLIHNFSRLWSQGFIPSSLRKTWWLARWHSDRSNKGYRSVFPMQIANNVGKHFRICCEAPIHTSWWSESKCSDGSVSSDSADVFFTSWDSAYWGSEIG